MKQPTQDTQPVIERPVTPYFKLAIGICHQRPDADAALSTFYGSSIPQTLDEQCEAAWRAKEGRS
jgi:hypothetical protein